MEITTDKIGELAKIYGTTTKKIEEKLKEEYS